uniref:Transcription cofactor HES-6-like n=1 Tax=Nothoprocta perdicaria TaxID=30464 RepID=A0A8C6ZM02_NOTPE
METENFCPFVISVFSRRRCFLFPFPVLGRCLSLRSGWGHPEERGVPAGDPSCHPTPPPSNPEHGAPQAQPDPGPCPAPGKPTRFSSLRKPLIERKRRERINNCLDQLKETVVGAFHLDVSQSKLEKADILEMTVKHLQNIQNNPTAALSPHQPQLYSTGYIQCMHEVHNLLLTCEWMDKTLGARLLNHLLKSLPRSGEDTCKTALRSSSPSQQPVLTPKSPPSPKGNAPGRSPLQEHFYLVENKQALKNAFQLPPPSVFSQADAVPPRQVLQPNFSHNNPNMGSLDMWRPW